MTIAHRFEVVLLLIAACVVLTVAAKRLRLPQAGALIAGGLALALVPGAVAFTTLAAGWVPLLVVPGLHALLCGI